MGLTHARLLHLQRSTTIIKTVGCGNDSADSDGNKEAKRHEKKMKYEGEDGMQNDNLQNPPYIYLLWGFTCYYHYLASSPAFAFTPHLVSRANIHAFAYIL